MIDSHFRLIQPFIVAHKKGKRDRDLAEVHAREKSIIKAIRQQIKRDFINDPDLMFENYDFEKKLESSKERVSRRQINRRGKLLSNQSEQAREEEDIINRRTVEEILENEKENEVVREVD